MIWIRRYTVLTGIILAILLGPRIGHAEENQTLLSKNDSNINAINQKLTGNLVRSVDVLQASKDRIEDSQPLPEKVKKVIANHPLEQVSDTVDGTTKTIKEAVRHSIKKTKRAETKYDTTSKLDTVKKPIHTVKHQDHPARSRAHLKIALKHPHRIAKSKNNNRHPKKGPQTQPEMTKTSIIQPNERPNQSGNSLNNGSNVQNVLGLLDDWLIHNISFNELLYLHDNHSTQWENAPPSPPPKQPLRFIS